MPLTWAQVRGDLDPKRYTVRTVPALLAKTKAWDGYDDAASSIKAAIKKLAAKIVGDPAIARGQSEACPRILDLRDRRARMRNRWARRNAPLPTLTIVNCEA